MFIIVSFPWPVASAHVELAPPNEPRVSRQRRLSARFAVTGGAGRVSRTCTQAVSTRRSGRLQSAPIAR
jgi:hypothetical protein